MKRFLLGGSVLAVLLVVVGLSQSRTTADPPGVGQSGLQVETAAKNPWTGLKLNVADDQFQFAVVADRTGAHRSKVFSKAVYQVNLLQPQFVMSVGDLIEGYSTKDDTITTEWNQFDAYVQKFEMPFFYTPGNHDIANKVMGQKWGERYGKKYFHFTYKNVLFLSLCTENPPDAINAIDPEQRDYVRKTLAANAGVRWTFVFLHRPIWTAKDLKKNGWAEVEEAFAGRKHTMFCGHVHKYQLYQRNGSQYFQLATTGGGSRLRGTEYGEFDHVAWVTMKKDRPLIANVMLDGILPADLTLPDTEEPGMKLKLVPTYPVAGTVTLDGKPIAGATVALYRFNKETEKYNGISNGLTDDAGRFKLSTYGRFDGAPEGEFVVTVVKTGKGYDDGETNAKSLLPEVFATTAMTPLKITIQAGPNDVNLALTAK